MAFDAKSLLASHSHTQEGPGYRASPRVLSLSKPVRVERLARDRVTVDSAVADECSLIVHPEVFWQAPSAATATGRSGGWNRGSAGAGPTVDAGVKDLRAPGHILSGDKPAAEGGLPH